jgi:tRNA dimethylallyltransferase
MLPAPHKTAIIIAGPTASGKTAIAIKLAKHFRTEIISADSRQCFKELNIGVARPSEAELKEIRHHFIASHSIKEEINAAGFEQYALQKAATIFSKHDFLILTGGTGLYIKAFCEGLDEIPPADPSLRRSIIDTYETRGIGWLQNELIKKDELFSTKGEMKNPQRMMRALEVMETTGKSILSFHTRPKIKRDFHIIKTALRLPKEQLDRQISERTEKMIRNGLLEEVKSLGAYRHLHALQTLGYSEIFDHLDGKISLNNAVERIRIHTRQYAKRQMTWLRKDTSFHWFHPGEEKEILDRVEDRSSA